MQWKPKPKGVAPEGLYQARILSTKYLGDKKTKYGVKRDVQAFVFRVQDGAEEKDIHDAYPMSVHETSNFRKLLIALSISPAYVEKNGIYPDDFVGKLVNIQVFHKTTRGVLHANVIPLPPTPKPEPESDFVICLEGDCTNAVDITVPAQKETSRCYRP